MNGILLIDKPTEWTSFDVVNKIRRAVQHSEFNTSNKKRFPVGHTGTLDPLATGLLVILLGNATKQAPGLTKLNKTYEVVMKLGEVSTTGDDEGEKTPISDARPTRAEIETALAGFVGDIMQTPPIFSAIKINGQRAYKLARDGKVPELAARPVHIESIDHISYDYPYVHFTTLVSSGTYIRSLVQDVGAVLQTGAYMSGLRRTTVGKYSIADALTMDGLLPEVMQKHLIWEELPGAAEAISTNTINTVNQDMQQSDS